MSLTVLILMRILKFRRGKPTMAGLDSFYNGIFLTLLPMFLTAID
jgi:hypothetical protein